MVTSVVTQYDNLSAGQVRKARTEQKRYPGIFLNDKRNRWEQRVTLDGRRLLFSAKSPHEVAAKVAAAKARSARGLPGDTSRITVKNYLEHWSTEVLPSTVAPSTLSSYRLVIKYYIVP